MAREGSFTIDIRDNYDEVAKVVDKDYPGAVKSATAIAMNRALAKGRTLTIRKIAKRMGIPQKFIRDRVKLSRAHRLNLRARLNVRGRPLNVARFGAQQVKAGVKHGAWKTGRGKKLAEGAFLVKIKSPKSDLTHFVAHRPGGGRKIKGVWGPWPPQEFIGHTRGRDKGVRAEVAVDIEKFFDDLYIYEVQRQIDIANGKIKRPQGRSGRRGR